MWKKLLVTSTLVLGFAANAYAASVSPTSITVGTSPSIVVDAGGNAVAEYDPNLNYWGAVTSGTYPYGDLFDDTVGTWHFLLVNDDQTCAGLTYSQCLASGDYLGSEFDVVVSSPSTGSEVTVDTIISNASSTFTGAVGFNWADVVGFMKSLLLLVMGSGLGLLETLLPYIIALITIGAIVYFLYRAFRFFRH